MDRYDLTRCEILGDASSFYSDNAISKRKYYSGEHTRSIDGTGVDESVTRALAENIVKYITDKFICDNLKSIDVGAGTGQLQRALNASGVDAFSMEGSQNLIDHIVASKDKYALVNLTLPMSDEKLKKAFHISTSFEAIEHIHLDELDIFFDNMEYMSHYHLCSIHVSGGTDEHHCNVKPPSWWADYFRNNGIEFEVVGTYPRSGGEFRATTGLDKSQDWRASMFVILNFNPEE